MSVLNFINNHHVRIDDHTIKLEDDSLIVDGKILDVKLKNSLFHKNEIKTVNTINDVTKIKIGKNELILKGNFLAVNGQEFNIQKQREPEKMAPIPNATGKINNTPYNKEL